MGWLAKLLCRMDYHAWAYGYQNIQLEDETIYRGYVTRTCKRCPVKETECPRGRASFEWVRQILKGK